MMGYRSPAAESRTTASNTINNTTLNQGGCSTTKTSSLMGNSFEQSQQQ